MLMEMGCLSLECTLSEAYESSFFFLFTEGGNEEWVSVETFEGAKQLSLFLPSILCSSR